MINCDNRECSELDWFSSWFDRFDSCAGYTLQSYFWRNDDCDSNLIYYCAIYNWFQKQS